MCDTNREDAMLDEIKRRIASYKESMKVASAGEYRSLVIINIELQELVDLFER